MILALIPAYNEEKTIGSQVRETSFFVDEVVICDDGSSDRTSKIAKKNGAHVVQHNVNQGKGAALKSLFNYANKKNAEISITLDADGQHDAKDIPLMIQTMRDQNADVVAGSRFLSQNKEMPKHRRLGNKILNLIINISTKQSFSDTQCGFRAYSNKAIKLVEITSDKIGQVDSEILMAANTLGLKIIEVPVSCKYHNIRKSTYNPIVYVLEVIVFVIRQIFLKHPLSSFGISGLLVLILGIGFLFSILHFYPTTEFNFIKAILFSILFIIIGVSSIFTGIILYAITKISTVNQNKVKTG